MTKLAAAAYPIEALTTWDALVAKLGAWLDQSEDANFVVFPEYAGLEAGLIGATSALTVADETQRCADSADQYWRALSDLSQAQDKIILSGSLPARAADGALVNRAGLFLPDGRSAFTDKTILTPWERRETELRGAPYRHVYDAPGLPRVGVMACYDGEFPLHGRALKQAGAAILTMPSATDGMRGHTRVQLGARARALGCNALVMLSQIVGTCPQSSFADVSTGCAGLYTPPDEGLPDTGILAETALNEPGWAIAHMPTFPDAVSRQINISAHWDEQSTQAQIAAFK